FGLPQGQAGRRVPVQPWADRGHASRGLGHQRSLRRGRRQKVARRRLPARTGPRKVPGEKSEERRRRDSRFIAVRRLSLGPSDRIAADGVNLPYLSAVYGGYREERFADPYRRA